ncbi:MAG: hypothetical protein RMK49_20915 [Abditibacteriales bacterium]|nr:hypothetical protein [Abditibacteriales bacterium]
MMKFRGFLALVIGVSVGWLVGCGGGRGLVDASRQLSNVNDGVALLGAGEANADIKFAKRRKPKSPPVIHSASVTPTQLGSGGGQVTVTANVTSKIKRLVVTAQATSAGSSPILGTLNAIGGGNYSGVLFLSGSFSGVPKVYQIDVIANDGKNAPVSRSAGTVTVAGTTGGGGGGGGGDGPPPPPF